MTTNGHHEPTRRRPDPAEAAEIDRLGREIFDRTIAPRLAASDRHKFVVIDVDTGKYEIEERDADASVRILGRNPQGRFFSVRVGHAAPYRIGFRSGSRA